MEDTWKGSERRQYPRLSEALRVQYRVVDTDQVSIAERYIKATTINISAIGLQLETQEELLAGQALIMEILFEKPEHTVRCEAEVVWVDKRESKKYNVGMKFVNLDEKTINMLVDYVDERLSE